MKLLYRRLKDHFNRHITEIKVMEDIDEGLIVGTSSSSCSYTPKTNGMSGNNITNRSSIIPRTPTNRSFSPLLKSPSIASLDSSVLTGLSSSNYYHDNSSFEPLPNVSNLLYTYYN